MKPNFEAKSISVPSLNEISELYKKAVSSQDAGLKSAAEQALLRLAGAEGAAAEAAALVAFHSRNQ